MFVTFCQLFKNNFEVLFQIASIQGHWVTSQVDEYYYIHTSDLSKLHKTFGFLKENNYQLTIICCVKTLSTKREKNFSNVLTLLSSER